MQGYQGGICGYRYEPANGDPGANIPANPAFEDLPADWVWPIWGRERAVHCRVMSLATRWKLPRPSEGSTG